MAAHSFPLLQFLPPAEISPPPFFFPPVEIALMSYPLPILAVYFPPIAETTNKSQPQEIVIMAEEKYQ